MKKVFVTVISILCIILVGCSGNNNPPVGTSDDNYEIIISDVIQVYVWKDNQIVPQLVNDKGEVIDARYDYVSSSDDITISFDGHITINSIPEGDVTVTITERNTGVQKNITLQFIADIQKVNAVSKETGEVVTELNGLSYNSKTTLNVITDQTDIDISSFCDITCTDKNGNEVSGFDIEYNKNHILLTATGLGEGTLKIQISNSKGENLYQTSIPFSINWDEIALQNCVLNSVEKTLLSKEDITSIKSITIDEQVKLLLEVEHLSSLETIVIDSAEVQEFIYDSVIYNYRVKEHLYDDYYNHEFWANKQGNLIPYKNSTSENYIVYHSDRSTTMSVSLITNTLAFPVLEFDGYTNIGWKNSFDKTVEASELLTFDMGVIHLYAIWEANGNRVVFNGNGATSGNMEDQIIATDSSASLTQNTYIRAGYTFVGWATIPDGDVVYSDCASFAMDKTSVTNLYAVWAPNENGINYHANGGTGTMSVQSASTGETKALSQNQFTRSGYTFSGWSTTPTGAVEYVDQAHYTMGSESSYTLYAVWTPIQYTITYDLAGGTDMGNPEQYNIESNQITLIAPTRQGYVFAGWTNESISDPTKEVSISTGTIGNKSYTAVWAATLYFHANGGEGTIASVTVINNTSEYVLPKHTYIRDGYLFDGWALSATGAIAYEKESVFTCGADGEYHLYAIWNEGTEGLLFRRDGTGYSVVGYSGTLTDITVPSKYRGLTVTHIVASAFANNTTVHSIVLPNSIQSIDANAFAGCSSIESMTLPFVGLQKQEKNSSDDAYPIGLIFGRDNYSGSIGTEQRYYAYNGVGYQNFSGTFYIPASLKSVTITDNSIPAYAFYNCEGINSIILSDNVEFVGNDAFYNCNNLICNEYGNAYYLGSANNKYVVLVKAKSIDISTCEIHANTRIIASRAFEGSTSFDKLTISDNVKYIGSYAFSNCSALTQISWGNSIEFIGKSAFSGCRSLNDLTLPNSIISIDSYAFSGCTGLERITLGNGLKEIKDGTFNDCSNLLSINIPSSITNITGTYTFSGCSKLEEVHITDLAAWCNIVFNDQSLFENVMVNPLYYSQKLYLNGELITELVIPEGITEIGDYAFVYCTDIVSIKMPNSIASIGDSAFSGCSSVSNIVFSSNLQYIGKCAFRNCDSLTSIVLPDNLRSIDDAAFSSCDNLQTLHLGGCTNMSFDSDSFDTIKTIIAGSYNIVNLTVSENNTKYYSKNNCIITFDGTELVLGCSASIIPNDGSVTVIGKYAFSNIGVSSIEIPSKIKQIKSYAFYYNQKLSVVTLGSGLELIGESAFSNCSNLTSVTIPASVTEIGRYAFYRCSKLESVRFIKQDGWGRDVSDPAIAAEYLVDRYASSTWKVK